MSPFLWLENDHLKASISPEHGARICSLCWHDGQRWNELFTKCQNLSHKSWSHGGMPLLWPFSGRSWDQDELAWRFENTKFTMPIHGFAWQMKWRVADYDKTFVSLELSSDQQTLQHYPFKFCLKLRYEILESGLMVKLDVFNLETCSHKRMPFYLGWHPYFYLPFDSNFTLTTDTLQSYAVTRDGRLGDPIPNITKWPHELHSSCLSKINDTLPLKVNMRAPAYNLSWRLQQDLSWLVFWHDSDTRSICIEPWQAPPNALTDDPKSVKWLEPDRCYSTSFTLEATKVDRNLTDAFA